MIRMSAIPRDVKAHIALCGRWKATQCDFDAKYRWCGNAGTQVAIRRIAADDRPQSLRDSSPGPASGDACGHGPPGLHSPTNSSRALSGDSSSKCRAVSARHAEMWITPEPSTTSVVFRPPPCIGVRCWGCRGAGTFRRPTTEWGERLMLNDDLDGQRGAWHHPQVRYDRHAIRRRQFALRRRERCKRTMIRLCCMSVAVMFAAMMNWALLRVPPHPPGKRSSPR